MCLFCGHREVFLLQTEGRLSAIWESELNDQSKMYANFTILSLLLQNLKRLSLLRSAVHPLVLITEVEIRKVVKVYWYTEI